MTSISFDYTVKRQRRKTMALHVLDDATVEVRVPKWVLKSDIIQFITEKADWVIEQRNQRLLKLSLKPRFANGQYHPYLGNQLPLKIIRSVRTSAIIQDGVLLVYTRNIDNELLIERALEAFYRQRAYEIFEERLFACFERFPNWFQDQFIMPQITVRKMRRRWGSCSNRGEITLNLWLIKMQVECIDYVITHELCHLKAFDHGRVFYGLLTQVMPDWRMRELLIENQ